MREYGELSILERKVYTRSQDYKPQYGNRSVMEVAVYNRTTSKKVSLWQRFLQFLRK